MKTGVGAQLATVAEVKNLLAPLAADPMLDLAGDDLLHLTRQVETIGHLIDALRATLAAQINHLSRRGLEDNVAEKHGYSRGKHLIEAVTGATNTDVGRRIRLGDAIRPRPTLTGEVLPSAHPIVADAVRAGEINMDAAAVIIHCVDQAGRVAPTEQIWQAETILVNLAGDTPADSVKEQARLIRDYLDPDGTRPREDEIQQRRSLTVGAEYRGLTPISGLLAPECAALLRSVFDEVNNPGAKPRFVDGNPWNTKAPVAETTDDTTGETTIQVLDHRTTAQKQHDALYGLLKAGVRATGTEPGGMASHAEVTAVIREEDLLTGRGVGWIDRVGEPVTAETLKIWLCDASYRTALLGNTGEVLALGRTQYPFTPGQRKAIVLRDGGCVSCGAPAAWGDIHHVQPYRADGGTGRTDTNNGVVLCRACHTWLHRSDYRMCMINGIPHLLAPPGIDPKQRWKRLRTSRINFHLPKPEPPPF